MKLTNFLFLPMFVLSISCDPQPKDISTQDITNSQTADGKNASNLADIKFEEETHDFGRITQGEKVSFGFKFKNTGSANLIISSASGSCGCTVPEFPKKPIAAGDEGTVNVVFSSEGKSGVVEKSVTIVTNCEPSTKIIYIKANIIVPTNANSNETPTTKH